MELQQLQYFLTCAQEGSVTKAAEALYTSQPHVSQVIKTLENELGVVLFHRSASGITLTKEGEQIHFYAESILKNAGLISQISRDASVPALRIAANPSSSLAFLLGDFIQTLAGSNLTLHYRECGIEQMMELLQNRQYDLGFLFVPENKRAAFSYLTARHHLLYTPLRSTDLVLHAGRKNPWYGKPSVKPEELSACSFIQPEDDFFSVEDLLRKANDFSNVDGTGRKIAMITDTGGINDQSFNQSAWEGLQHLQEETGADVNYIESKQTGDFMTNLETLIDNGNTLCWGIGFACADAVVEAAAANPDVTFACVDNAFSDPAPNLTGVVFRAQESSFMVGYIAAAVSETEKVGFVGGISSEVIDQFQYGYEAGVAYANSVLGKNVTVTSQYAESFSDAAKGKSIANKMFTDGCDIVYHAAGGTGTGVIEAAREVDKFAIGVDRDQAYLAPDNVLTSSLKNVDVAVDLVSRQHIAGRQIGGQNMGFGLTDDAVGIPEHHENYSDEIYNAAIEIGEQIKRGAIVPPATKDELEAYKETLK